MIEVVFFDLGETLVTRTREWLPGAKAVLAALRARGMRLGIISNTGQLTRHELKSDLPPDFDFAQFDADLLVLSSEVGVAKPDLQIFYEALRRAATVASACLFCTENPADTLVAQTAGMRALRVGAGEASDIETLEALLSHHGMI